MEKKNAIAERNERANVDVNENLLILIPLACAHDVNTRAFPSRTGHARYTLRKKSSNLLYRSVDCFQLREKLLLRPRFTEVVCVGIALSLVTRGTL